MPVTVTTQARVALGEMMDRFGSEPGKALRLTIGPVGNAHLVLDSQREDDRLIKHQDRTVLLISPDVDQQLEHRKLDARGGNGKVEMTLSL